MALSATTIDTGLWHIQRDLIERHGCDQAERDIAPLRYYIATGRASTAFLRALLNAKPFMIARKLHKGGSDMEVIDRIKDYLDLKEV